MTCEQRRDLLLLYVSDALEAEEMQEMRIHLETGCPTCAGGLAEAQAVFASVPFALADFAPPTKVKANLMRRIDEYSSRSVGQTAYESESLPIRLFRYFVPTAIAACLAIVGTHWVMNRDLVNLQQQRRELTLEASQANMLGYQRGSAA